MYAIIDEEVPVAIDTYSGIVAEMDTGKVAVNLAAVVDKLDRLKILPVIYLSLLIP
jgi:tetrahydromethanopterin S-methyltransferase subunit B